MKVPDAGKPVFDWYCPARVQPEETSASRPNGASISGAGWAGPSAKHARETMAQAPPFTFQWGRRHLGKGEERIEEPRPEFAEPVLGPLPSQLWIHVEAGSQVPIVVLEQYDPFWSWTKFLRPALEKLINLRPPPSYENIPPTMTRERTDMTSSFDAGRFQNFEQPTLSLSASGDKGNLQD